MTVTLQDVMTAIKDNNLERLNQLLAIDPKQIEACDDKGMVPAFLAAQLGHYDLVKYLLEYTRVSMNVWDHHHQTILHYSAMSNHEACFAYLVERINMDPLEVNLEGLTPLDVAHDYDAKAIIAYYKDKLGITLSSLYRNPVVRGTFPDPSVVRVDEDYYMVHSSFVYFPCIPIMHSKDLVHWTLIGHAITDSDFIDLSQLEDGRGFWAPDISYHEGRFYITATLRMNDTDSPIRKQMVVHSEQATGPYSRPTYIEEDGIDPSIFTDEDGRRYMLLNRGARIFEISQDGSRQLSEPKMLWYGSQKRAPEAPHLLKKDGYYYVFVSEGGTGRDHQISVARSKQLMGPYEACPFNPILKQNDPDHPIQRSGHGKLVETPSGDWYITYLCGRMIDQKYSILGRETALDKVTWTKDGWPMVNDLKGPSGAALAPKLQGYEVSPSKTKGLNPVWHFVRRPALDALVVDDANDTLWLRPGPYDLDHQLARNVLVQRQTAFCHTQQVMLDVKVMSKDTEASLINYYDKRTYLKYSVAPTPTGHKLFVTERIDHAVYHHFVTPVILKDAAALELQIRVDNLCRSFYYRLSKTEDWQLLGTLQEVTYLCDEGVAGGKRFTGAMIGLFVYGQVATDLIGFKGFKLCDS